MQVDMNEHEQVIKSVKKGSISYIYEQKKDFIVIGLTGQKGSGCSSVAKILGHKYKELNFEQLSIPDGATEYDSIRDERIIETYAYQHWVPFDIIYVRDIIMVFIIRDQFEFFLSQLDLNQFFETFSLELQKSRAFHNIDKRIIDIDSTESKPFDSSKKTPRTQNIINMYTAHIDHFLDVLNKLGVETPEHFPEALAALMKYYNNTLIGTWFQKVPSESYASTMGIPQQQLNEERFSLCYTYVKAILPAFSIAFKKALPPEVNYTVEFQKFGNQIRFYGAIKSPRSILPYSANEQPFAPSQNTFSIPKMINCFIKAYRHPESEDQRISVRVVIDAIKNPYESMYLRSRYSAFYLISVTRDNIIRKAGLKEREPAFDDFELELIDYNERPSVARKLFLPFWDAAIHFCEEEAKTKSGLGPQPSDPIDRIVYIISTICSQSYSSEHQPTPINQPVACTSCTKTSSAASAYPLGLPLKLSEKFRKYVAKLHLNNIELLVCESIISDPVRVFSLINGLYEFFLQDVESCIQDSDIFIANNETDIGKRRLKSTIARYISLISHPGLVTPTPLERCMQIAYTAKLNSGCISRQVGAVVTDSQYRILSLGWNDVPDGQTSCNRRSLIDLCRYIDPFAFSDYEKGKGEFRKLYLDKFDFTDSRILRDTLEGVPAAFCFKDAYCEISHNKNQIHTRAMHGEEKALLTCDQMRVQGGYLFTTSSPCELCAKNAKAHHIKKIFYIEPYPGISQSHICDSGDEDNRAIFELFQGAIGRAYTQLYTPVIPLKDELTLRGLYSLSK